MPDAIEPNRTAVSRSGLSHAARVVFAISVTLNLLVLGVVAGGILAHGWGPPPPRVGEVNLGPFTRALSPQDREAIRGKAEAEGRGFRDMRREDQHDFDAFLQVVETDPFDAHQAEALLGARRARLNERIEIGETLLVERLGEMSLPQRRDFAQKLRQGPGSGPNGGPNGADKASAPGDAPHPPEP